MQQQRAIIPLSHGIGKSGQTIHACLQVMPDPVPCRNGFPPEQDCCHLATTGPCPVSIQKTQGKNQPFPARRRQYEGIMTGTLPHGGTPPLQVQNGIDTYLFLTAWGVLKRIVPGAGVEAHIHMRKTLPSGHDVASAVVPVSQDILDEARAKLNIHYTVLNNDSIERQNAA